VTKIFLKSILLSEIPQVLKISLFQIKAIYSIKKNMEEGGKKKNNNNKKCWSVSFLNCPLRFLIEMHQLIFEVI